jgi:YaiO family outer membrane protein
VAVLIEAFAAGSANGQAVDEESVKTPRDYSIEAGVGLGSYPDEFAHSEFASLSVSRPFKDTWRFSASHDKRFGDSGIGVGAGYSYYWRSGYNLSVGVSTGTGEVIHPRYAVGITGGKNVLSNLSLSLSYLRWQARDDSRSDAFMIGATWYAAGHWIIGGGARANLGQPGSEWSFSADFGVTYAVYRNTYVSAGFTVADVAYQLATSPPGTAVIEYSDSS